MIAEARMTKYKLSLLFILCLFFIACGEIGKEFESYGDFMDYEKEQGYIFLGRFQDVWPAEIKDVDTAMDEISFVLPSGTPHVYSGYKGYELKVVKLSSEKWKREFAIVLRSQTKKEEEKDIY